MLLYWKKFVGKNFFIFNQGCFFTRCCFVRQKWLYSFSKIFIVGNNFFLKTAVIERRNSFFVFYTLFYFARPSKFVSNSSNFHNICGQCLLHEGWVVTSCVFLFTGCMVVYSLLTYFKKIKKTFIFASVFAIANLKSKSSLRLSLSTFYNPCSLWFLVEVSETSFSLRLPSFCKSMADQSQKQNNFESFVVYLSKLSLYRKEF